MEEAMNIEGQVEEALAAGSRGDETGNRDVCCNLYLFWQSLISDFNNR